MPKDYKDYYNSAENSGMMEKVGELIRKYQPRMEKKMQGKPLEVREMMANSFNTAVLVVAQLYDVPVHEQIMSVFVYCRNEPFRAISKEYEAQIELASIDPEKFIFQLHPFYNSIAAKIRRDGMLEIFAQFMAVFSRLRYTKPGETGMNADVAIAFTHLIYQTFDYLRPQKLDVTQTVVGVTTSGGAITIKDPFAYADMPGWDLSLANIQDSKLGKTAPLTLPEAYMKYGFYNIPTIDEATVLGREQRIFACVRSAMLPFINEFTFDIFPVIPHNGVVQRLVMMRARDVDVNGLHESLHKRRRTLPTNGVRIEFQDETECIKSLLLKELVFGDSVVLLYRLSVDESADSEKAKYGDMSGYYDTNSEFFFSVAKESKDTNMPLFIEKLVLFAYAAQVLDNDSFSEASFREHFSNFIYPIGIKCYGMGGKLKSTFSNEEQSHNVPRRSNDRYEAKEQAINGFIRKLPAGQRASDEAIERAKKLGYELAPDETYVSPFIRTEFYLKKKDDESLQGEES